MTEEEQFLITAVLADKKLSHSEWLQVILQIDAGEPVPGFTDEQIQVIQMIRLNRVSMDSIN